jgi:DNA ligase (NAD+)
MNWVITLANFGSMNAITAATVEEIEQALRSRRRVKEKETKPGKAAKTKEAGVIARNIRQYLDGRFGKEIVYDLAELGVNMAAPRLARVGLQKLEGKTFVVTGSLQKYSRDQIEELITQHGGHAASSVSKNTDYLLVGDNPGSKLEKAQQLGVAVISEKDFEDLLHG